MHSSSCLGQNLDNKKIENKNDYVQGKQVLHSVSVSGITKSFSSKEKAIQYGLKLIDWANNNETVDEIIDSKSALLAVYMTLNMHLEAITIAKKILAYQEVTNSRSSVDVLFALKEAYRKSERFDDLLEVLPVYYEASERFGYAVIGGAVYEKEIAYVHYSLNNYEKAIASFKKSAEEFRIKKMYLMQSSSLNDIGTCFRYLKQKDSAHYYYKNGLNVLKDLQKEIKRKDGYTNYFENILKINVAETSLEKMTVAKMIALYNEILVDAKNTNEINIVINSYYGLSKVFFDKKDIEMTLKYLDSAEVRLKSYVYPKVKVKILELKVEALLSKKDFVKANTYFQVYKKFSDSLNTVKIDKSFMNGVLKYETDIKTKELQHVKEVVKSGEKIILYQRLGLVGLFLLFALLVFIFLKINRDNRIIRQQKLVVDKALAENKILIKEVHHRVKNNLQMVSSLFFLHSRKSKESNSEEILAQSQQQIQSMSIVHEMLYEKEDIIDVPAQEYIKKLTSTLLTAYPNKLIYVAISAENISLHLDYANPIGLIINELITNSIKHGFKDKAKGEVSIQLRKTNQVYEFEYSDNGTGMEEVEQTQKNKKTFGIRLITSLAEEMNGELEIIYGKKLTYKITFLDTNKQA
jgi:two-component sensor histidine kinase